MKFDDFENNRRFYSLYLICTEVEAFFFVILTFAEELHSKLDTNDVFLRCIFLQQTQLNNQMEND